MALRFGRRSFGRKGFKQGIPSRKGRSGRIKRSSSFKKFIRSSWKRKNSRKKFS